MKQLISLISTLCILLLPLQACSVSLFPSTEKEAKAYIDKVVPEIVGTWDETVLTHYAHSDLYKTTDREKVKQLFFAFRRLGGLNEHKEAQG